MEKTLKKMEPWLEILKKHKMPEEVIVVFKEACYYAAPQENYIKQLQEMLHHS